METKKAQKVYLEEFKVHTYEVDIHNQLTIQAMAQFLQEAASNHAATLGFGVEYLLGKNRTWVLSRLAVDIETIVALGETITIKTWPAETEKFFYIRDFEITGKDGKKIGKATSYWIYLDTKTGRPIHPSKNEILFDYEGIERGFDRKLPKLPSLEEQLPVKSFQVRYSDLDLNNHVNNIKYIEWALEAISMDYKSENKPLSMEINFLAEAKYENRVEIGISETDPYSFIHTITMDGTTICIAKTNWKPVKTN